MDRYGFTGVQWTSAIEEATAILRQCARVDPGTISYSDLAKQLTSITIGPHEHAMNYLLEQVSKEEFTCGRPLLSVVVVHKTGDQEPCKGFYVLAEELGLDVSDREACWISEFKRATDYWREYPPPRLS